MSLPQVSFAKATYLDSFVYSVLNFPFNFIVLRVLSSFHTSLFLVVVFSWFSGFGCEVFRLHHIPESP